mgnify:FL=1
MLEMKLAQVIENPLIRNKDLSGQEFAAQFLPRLITLVLVVAGVVFLFVLLLGGISWMTAGGDKTQVEAARSRVTNAIIGLFIVFVAFALATLVEGLFGVNILTLDIGKLILR